MSRTLTRTDSCTSVKTPLGIRKVNQYLLIKSVGEGAYGEVFMAVNPSNEEKEFAIKMIKKSRIPKLPTTMLNEVEVLRLLHHPNIVHLAEVIDDTNDKNLYLVM